MELAFEAGEEALVGRRGSFDYQGRSDVHVRDAGLDVQERGVEWAHRLHGCSSLARVISGGGALIDDDQHPLPGAYPGCARRATVGARSAPYPGVRVRNWTAVERPLDRKSVV